MTVFAGQEMVNFPAPQKPDPKISPHGIHTVLRNMPEKGFNAELVKMKDTVFNFTMFFPKDVSSQGSSEDCWHISHHAYQ